MNKIFEHHTKEILQELQMEQWRKMYPDLSDARITQLITLEKLMQVKTPTPAPDISSIAIEIPVEYLYEREIERESERESEFVYIDKN